MKANCVRFSPPVLDGTAKTHYEALYQDAGVQFMNVLNTSPNEIAVLSRMLVYLNEKSGGIKNGFAEDCKRDRSA